MCIKGETELISVNIESEKDNIIFKIHKKSSRFISSLIFLCLHTFVGVQIYIFIICDCTRSRDEQRGK